MIIGEKLKKLRKEAKVTQKVVAEHLGVGVNTYSQYENDLRQPPYAVLEKIVEYFHTDYNFVFRSGRENNDYFDQLDKFFDKYVNLRRRINKFNRYLATAIDEKDTESIEELKFRLRQMHDKLYKYNQTFYVIQFGKDRDVYYLESQRNFSMEEYDRDVEKMNEKIDYNRVIWDDNY